MFVLCRFIWLFVWVSPLYVGLCSVICLWLDYFVCMAAASVFDGSLLGVFVFNC